MTVPRVLIIAGSDSGGGAGIQADIKTVMAFGGYACTAVTAITAQNTLGVAKVQVLAPDMIVAQIDSVLSDIGADAIKIGMIGSAASAIAIADRLSNLDVPIIFDPVMVATSGARLATSTTIAAFERLMAMAMLVTPNLPELEQLSPAGALALASRTGAAILEKGGHAAGDQMVDRLVRPDGSSRSWTSVRIPTVHTHGTGCSLASAIAVGLASGKSLEDAITAARDYVRAAIQLAPGLGQGTGPLGHAAAAGLYPSESIC